MKQTFYLFACVFLLCGQFANAESKYEKNRIAISADGNVQADHHSEAKWPRADEDDWAGTAATLAMLAKRNLHEQLVQY